MVHAWAGGHDALRDALHRGLQIYHHPTVVLRRTVLDAAGGYDPEFEPAEDFELWLRLANVTRLACLSDTLLDMRLRPDGVCATRTRPQIAAFRRALDQHAPPARGPASGAALDRRRHLATIALAHRDRGAALTQGLVGLREAPLHPRTGPWFARLLARIVLGPRT